MRLDDYLRRVGVRGPLRPDAETLRRLHVGHRETFPFENLTIQTGGTISLARADLERKFLDEGRGGYCFEHNTLFAAALRDVGFTPSTLLARVRHGTDPERRGRTHMLLRVPIESDVWIADVGFGALSLVEPMRLADASRSNQLGITYVLRRDPAAPGPPLWVLSMQEASSAADLYEFSEDPQTLADVEIANHYTATHPASIFRRTLTIQRITRDERIILRGGTIVRYRDGVAVEEPVARAELARVAREVMGIELPPGPFLCDAAPAAVPETLG